MNAGTRPYRVSTVLLFKKQDMPHLSFSNEKLQFPIVGDDAEREGFKKSEKLFYLLFFPLIGNRSFHKNLDKLTKFCEKMHRKPKNMLENFTKHLTNSKMDVSYMT